MESRAESHYPNDQEKKADKNQKKSVDKPITPERIISETMYDIKSALGDEYDAWTHENPDEDMLRKSETVEIFDAPEDRHERFMQVHDIAQSGVKRFMETREYAYSIAASGCSMGHKAQHEKNLGDQFKDLIDLRNNLKQEANFYAPEH